MQHSTDLTGSNWDQAVIPSSAKYKSVDAQQPNDLKHLYLVLFCDLYHLVNSNYPIVAWNLNFVGQDKKIGLGIIVANNGKAFS